MACCLSPSRCTRQQRENRETTTNAAEAEVGNSSDVLETQIRKISTTSGDCPIKLSATSGERNKLCDGLCVCQKIPDSASRVAEISDSSLDIDLDDPNLLQALEECIQRGGMNSKSTVDVKDNNKVTVANKLNNLDFIGLFFKNFQQTDDSSPRNINVNRVVTPDCVDLRNRYIIAPIPPAEVPRSLETDVYMAAASEGSSSQPSCYQTGTNNSVPLAPANSPNEASVAHSFSRSAQRRSTLKRLSQKRIPPQCVTVRRRKSSLLAQYRRPLRRRLMESFKSGTSSSEVVAVRSADLGSRPPCLGQEFSPIRKSPGVGEESSSAMSSLSLRLRRSEFSNFSSKSILRNHQKALYGCRGSGNRTNSHFINLNQRDRSGRPSPGCVGKKCDCEAARRRPPLPPSHRRRVCGCNNCQQRSNLKQRSDLDLKTVQPHPVAIEHSTQKVQLWLNHLEEETAETPRTIPVRSRTLLLEPVYENQVSNQSCLRNRHFSIPYSRRKRARNLAAIRQRASVVECSLSTDMYSDDNDDSKELEMIYRMKWGRCEEYPADSDDRTEAVSSTGFLADKSATTDTKSSLLCTNLSPSDSNLVKTVQPSVELQFKSCDQSNGVNENIPANPLILNSVISEHARNDSTLIGDFRTPGVGDRTDNDRTIAAKSSQLRHLSNRQRSRIRHPLASSNCDTTDSDSTTFFNKPLTKHLPISRQQHSRRKGTILRRVKAVGRRIRLFRDTENILQTLAVL